MFFVFWCISSFGITMHHLKLQSTQNISIVIGCLILILLWMKIFLSWDCHTITRVPTEDFLILSYCFASAFNFNAAIVHGAYTFDISCLEFVLVMDKFVLYFCSYFVNFLLKVEEAIAISMAQKRRPNIMKPMGMDSSLKKSQKKHAMLRYGLLNFCNTIPFFSEK